MSRKLYATLLPLLAVAAMAMSAGASQAAIPHWFECQKVGVGNGNFKDSECELSEAGGPWSWVKLTSTKVQVITFGKLTLTIGTTKITCKVLDGGNIWNPTGGGAGLDEILAFTNYECSISPTTECTEGLELIAEKLPWSTKLVEGVPIRDEITGINIRFKCTKPARNLLFTGTLKPKFVLGHPSFFEFDTESGHLTNTEVGEATVSGKDHIITDEGREVKAE